MSNIPTIAIVDDDQAIRDAMDGLLQSLGYRCAIFASAEAFLGFAADGGIDCLITDVKMPGLTGLALQDRLRQQGSRLPIIFMTSYYDEITRMRAMEGGALFFLNKPVDDEVLIHCLNAALETPGAG